MILAMSFIQSLRPCTWHLPDIDPVLLHLGPVSVRWYALAYVAGIVLGWLYAAPPAAPGETVAA